VTPFESRALLSRHRLRPTAGRLGILDLLASSGSPLSAAEVHEGLGDGRPDLATVYRNLERFAAASIVRPVRFEDGARRYEIAGGDHHHHLVCTTCGEIEDLASCRIEPFAEAALHRHGFQVASHSLEFYGTCRKCSISPH
jgi:Fur family ferric uptake transcriptional regulator